MGPGNRLFSSWWRYKLVFPALSVLPRALGYRLADGIGRWDALVDPHRGAVAAGMTKVFPMLAQDPARLGQYLIRYHQFRARDVLDCFTMPRLTAENAENFLRVNNLDLLENARSCGKGVILGLPHFGRYFMLGPALRFRGQGFGLLSTDLGDDNPHYDPIELEYVRAKLKNGHDFCRGTWVTTEGDQRRFCRALQAGETMLIAFDGLETNSQSRLTFPFLGGTLALPGGVVRIMSKTGAKMVYVSVAEQGYELEMTVHTLPDDPLQSLAAAVKLFERDVAERPWLWFQWTAIAALWTARVPS